MEVHTVMPGELHFSTRSEAIIRTVLGSCVALVVWHPQYRIGGMCHYLLPSMRELQLDTEGLRYGDVALGELWSQMQTVSDPSEYVMRLYGGAAMFGDLLEGSIGDKNVAFALDWARDKGVVFDSQDVGGSISRTVRLNVDTGEIELKRYVALDQIEIQVVKGGKDDD